MKKTCIFLFLTLIFYACQNIEVKVKSAKANGHYTSGIEYHDGMKYLVYSIDYNSSQTGYAVYSINLTKDSLECEVYSKQLKKYK